MALQKLSPCLLTTPGPLIRGPGNNKRKQRMNTSTSGSSDTLGPASAAPRVRLTFRPSFYFGMTLIMAFFVFAGFGMSYWFPMASGSFPPAPPVVHLHGWVFSAWMILLVVQAALISGRNVMLHRSLGTFGIALATAVLLLGTLISVLGLSGGVRNPGPDFFDAMYLSFMAVTGFAILFTLAIRNVRRPEAHRRLILFSILPLLPPGVNRFYMIPFGLDTIPVIPLYLTLDAMALAILVHEWHHQGRIGRYSMIGAGWLLMQQILHVPVVESEAFLSFCQYVASLVHYR